MNANSITTATTEVAKTPRLVFNDSEKSSKLAFYLNDWNTGDRETRCRAIINVAILMDCGRDEATTILHFASDFFNVKETI